MRNNGHLLLFAACISGMVWGADTAWAEQDKQEDQSGPWNLSPTAAPFVKPESSISVGVGHLQGDRQNLGKFDGLNGDTREWLLLDTKIVKRDDATGTWSTVQGRNLGLNDNRSVTVGFEKQGEWGIRIGYDEISSVAPYTANSSVVGLGTTVQIIPTNIAPGAGKRYQIGTDVDRLSVNTFRFFDSNVKASMAFKNEIKEGTRQWGRRNGVLFTPDFLLEPIYWNIRQLEPTLSYVGENLQLLGGYSGSWFGNANAMVDTYQMGNTSHTYLSLPLDNEAHQLYLSGGYTLAPTTRSTFKLSYTRATQNEHLPTNDVLVNPDAPSSLQGRVDTTLAFLGLTAQPLPPLNITAKLRYYDENDKTPAWLVVQTYSTATPPALTAQVHSTPFSTRTLTGQLEGTYSLPYQIALTGGIERKDQKREIPFGNDLVVRDGLDDERFVPWRTNLDETTYKVQVRRHLSETINGALGFEHGVRTGSNYVDSVRIMGNSQGKIGPYFISDRDRDKLRFAMDWRPVDRLGLQLIVENATDDYGPDQAPYGRQKGKMQLYSVDADYAPVDNWLFTTWYSYDSNELWQYTGRWSNAGAHEADKNSVLKDSGHSVGLGVRNQWSDKLKVGADLQWSRAKSSYEDNVTLDPKINPATTPAYPSGMTPLPDSVTPVKRVGTFVEYKGLGPGTLRCDIVHEYWSTNDWTWKFSDGSPYIYGPAGAQTTDGTLISTTDSQSSNFFGVRYTTRFR